MADLVQRWVVRAWLLLFVVIGLMVTAILLAPPANAEMPDPGDELMFYRDGDGTFRYYDMGPTGGLASLLSGGAGYSTGWTSITAVDLDGGIRDELMFYRAGDGAFRYYDMKASGGLAKLLSGGMGYSKGWTSINGVDLNGDGKDELMFYRASDGAFRYYSMKPNGALSRLLSGGLGYSKGWTSITSVDLDNDRQHETLFYRSTDGTFRYYDMKASGGLASLLSGGSGYSSGWTSITGVNLEGDLPKERISSFTTYFACCQARVTNIRTMARALNGKVVMPGETFSIDAAIGPRTTAKGYVPAPYLQSGQGQCCAVGGGVSQFGTTMHNAVFWGGLKVVEHQPHSAWISRYPLGIEATLVYRSIDYRFTNDTVTPLTIRTSTTGTSLTVELWGNQGGWQVRGRHPTGATRSSISVLDAGDSTAKRVKATVSGSAPGAVRVVRTLVQGGGRRTQAWNWYYLG